MLCKLLLIQSCNVKKITEMYCHFSDTILHNGGYSYLVVQVNNGIKVQRMLIRTHSLFLKILCILKL